MGLVDRILNILGSEEARTWGTRIFVGAVAFDFLLSHDQVPGNSIREWMLAKTQGNLSVLPGLVIPYALAALLGHFYHLPGAESILPLKGYGNLFIVVIIGVILVMTRWLMDFPKSKYIWCIPIFGVIVGSVIWPVDKLPVP